MSGRNRLARLRGDLHVRRRSSWGPSAVFGMRLWRRGHALDMSTGSVHSASSHVNTLSASCYEPCNIYILPTIQNVGYRNISLVLGSLRGLESTFRLGSVTPYMQ